MENCACITVIYSTFFMFSRHKFQYGIEKLDCIIGLYVLGSSKRVVCSVNLFYSIKGKMISTGKC